MPITSQGIKGPLTEAEFKLLGYIAHELYIQTATRRFEGWDNSFNTSHPDWGARVRVQRDLADGLDHILESDPNYFRDLNEISAIYIAGSLGSIATLFGLDVLEKQNLAGKTRISLLDILYEPLIRTQRGEFQIPPEAISSAGIERMGPCGEMYKEHLRDSRLITSDMIELPRDIGDFNLVVSPYAHHHLNLFGKVRAAKEMERITRPGGYILVGDLTFKHQQFNDWLAKHEGETVSSGEEIPYALESFIPLEEHISYFPNSISVYTFRGPFHYVFALKKNGSENV